MRFLEGHTKFVQEVAFSPDGRTLASASADRTLRLWDLAAGRERAVLKGHEGWVAAVAFSPDGARLASGSHDGTVRLWDAATGSPLPSPGVNQGIVVSVAYSCDGLLAWGGYDRTVRVWRPDLDTGSVCFRCSSLVFAIAFAPDGRTLAAGGSGRTIRLWDLTTGKLLPSLRHDDRKGCRGLAWSADGRTLAAALGRGVELWDPRARRRIGLVADHADAVSAVAYSRDGRWLLSGSWDGTVRLYEVDPRRPGILREHSSRDWGLGKVFDVALAPDGMTAAAAGDDEPRLVVWDVD